MRSFVETNAYPDLPDATIDLAPVDATARHVLALTADAHAGGVFHVTNDAASPSVARLGSLVGEALVRCGHLRGIKGGVLFSLALLECVARLCPSSGDR